MALYELEIGDWGDDGHGKYVTLTAEISDNVTPETLAANYHHNVEVFGFTPEQIAENYADSSIDGAYVEKLRAAGFQFSESRIDYGRAPHGAIYDDEADGIMRDIAYQVDRYSLFGIVLFFFTHGLPGVTATPVVSSAISLRKLAGITGVGYGLFD